MTAVLADVRSGAYHDSVVLMRLQWSLSKLPGVLDAGVVMGTETNKNILSASGLLAPAAVAAGADDLVIVVKADSSAAANSALAMVDSLLAERRVGAQLEYQPRSLETAIEQLPDAQWVLVSVPGRYAAGVARDALRLGRNVFLYSDNVSLDDELELKRLAGASGLLIMGPDCGTAIVGGIGLGFANGVRRGPIGVVAASGTGLQQVSTQIHRLGSGLSHGLGTGGRDLSLAVGGVTAYQAIDLLERDPETRVIVLVSKPPDRAVASGVLRVLRRARKPAVANLIGYPFPARQVENLHFAGTFDEAAELAVRLAGVDREQGVVCRDPGEGQFAAGQRYLRGLFSGGTLAYEAQVLLENYVQEVLSNVPLRPERRLADPAVSRGHTIVDLGADEFTMGRLHPMMDNDLRRRRLQQESQDPEVAVILLDVVLGYGAHPDPASELAPAIATARQVAMKSGRSLEVVVMVVGTDQDPQGLESQIARLEGAGAHVETGSKAAVQHAGRLVERLGGRASLGDLRGTPTGIEPVALTALAEPLACINVGLEAFTDSLRAQGAPVVQVDWRPPAGGSERLMAILERMRRP